MQYQDYKRKNIIWKDRNSNILYVYFLFPSDHGKQVLSQLNWTTIQCSILYRKTELSNAAFYTGKLNYYRLKSINWSSGNNLNHKRSQKLHHQTTTTYQHIKATKDQKQTIQHNNLARYFFLYIVGGNIILGYNFGNPFFGCPLLEMQSDEAYGNQKRYMYCEYLTAWM